eukprot:TRINITY_DN13258_c0_g1_i1.p1 TRINITY_DN13258_c0_g1~~TRINITY_DN13258_c0_g1_i1.p1  ORF type:complete len:194 (+),score=37.83 TRINITY_DN13258_c0_g1_i1:20-601(+)
MPKTTGLRTHSKTSKAPRRPFEKERLDEELKLIGEFGLKNKREVWRVKLILAKLRKRARELLKLDEKDPKRLFEGGALLRRLHRLGVLDEDKNHLDYVLSLKIQNFLARRLQTQVYHLKLAKSIHHARVMILSRHIAIGNQIVNVPSYMVRVTAQKAIQVAKTSPFHPDGPAGRVKRKKLKSGAGKAASAEDL